MSLAGALEEELVNNAGVAAIEGTRVYMGSAIQDPTLPYIAYNVIGSNHEAVTGQHGKAAVM